MDNPICIEIVDKESGQNTEKDLYPPKRFYYIGSDPRSDVLLGTSGNPKGVSPKHLQVIAETGGSQAHCRVVNLSGSPIPVIGSPQNQLERLMDIEITGEECLSVGAFDLIFHLSEERVAVTRPVLAPVEAGVPAAANIGLRIELPQKPLTPETPLDGKVFVTNLSSQRDVQVALRLEGLPAGSYKLGQAPLLYPGAEQSVYLHLEHPRLPTILPGACKITICAEISIAGTVQRFYATQNVQISPFYEHSVRLIHAR